MTRQSSDRTVRSLDPIFSPRSVAVVGASRNRDSIGFSLIHNLLSGEFEGAVFPVNPNATSVHSLKAYPNLAAVPDPIDLAVIAVPSRLVLGVVEEAAAVGVRGLVVITAGFSETGAEGRALEQRLVAAVRASGMRMVGPNCMGVINTSAGVSMNATFAPTPARRGSIGFVSQSGALGVAILNVAADLGIGLTEFVSVGNKADVSGNDLLEYWEEDEATRVIAMYLESFGNPRHFTEIAKRVAAKKPILIVKSGRTAEGARAASSHTGALAGTDLTVSTFLDRCGVLRAESIEELFHVAQALDRCPVPAGSRVAIVTNAGGPAIMATDACVNLGLEITTLSDSTCEALAAFLPPEASLANPVDMIASATPDSYRRALTAVLDDPGVDMVMAINVTPLLANPIDVLDAIAAAADNAAESRHKPIVTVMMATEEFYDEAKRRPATPPVYRFPEPAARSLAMLARYAEWRARPTEAQVALPVDRDAVERILGGATDGYLPPGDAFALLEAYGIPVAAYRVVDSAGDAAAAAGEIGRQVAVKAIAPELVHKSDVGGVALALEGAQAVRDAVGKMEERLAAAGHSPSGFLVQEMAGGGHEVIFGISTDPRFGPLLMFGLGGKYVEVFRNVGFAVPPLNRHEADELVRKIRGFPLLEGVRGEAPADLDRLGDVLLRLSQLSQEHPEVVELDINPFIAAPSGRDAKALDARVKVEKESAGQEA